MCALQSLRGHSIDFARLLLLAGCMAVLMMWSGQASGESLKTVVMNSEQYVKAEGFRVAMIHRDAFMDEESLRGVARLKSAAESSQRRMHTLARRREVMMKKMKGEYGEKEAAMEMRKVDAQVSSSNDGAYVVEMAIGTPPQKFIALLDTGSDFVWRQSLPCAECYNQTGPLFQPNVSSTYRRAGCNDTFCKMFSFPQCTHNACQYTVQYADGSISGGYLSYDSLTIGGLVAKNFVFGAGFLNTGDIGSGGGGAGGLVGMGGGPLSLPSQMASTIDNKFSYCLVTWTDAPSKTSPLLFGSSATTLFNTTHVQSTPLLANGSTLYYIGLKAISLDGKLLDIPNGTFDLQPDGSGGTFVDSGTTLTMLVDAAYTPLRTAYSSIINLPPIDGSSIGFDLCYNNSNAAAKITIPSLVFHFDGADLTLPPENIFVDFQGYFCLGFNNSAPYDFNVFGNIQQQNFQFLFDTSPKNKLFVRPTQCDNI